MATVSSCQNAIFDIIDKNKGEIKKISDKIWQNPEKSCEEKIAHDVLTQYLSTAGFEVETNYVLGTGFRAIFKNELDQHANDGGGDKKIVNVCFLCEYDALPEVGHAAGHNLVSAVSIAAATAIKSIIIDKKLPGKVTVLGTPGEDTRGGKIAMIKHGSFCDVDCCMMALPMTANVVYPKHYRLLMVTVNYTGKAAHASAYPWEGRNALDAAVACYNNIALLRQQLKPTWTINVIITKGGTQANLIPDHTELKCWIRAPTATDMHLIQQKCTACFIAAAKATNTVAEFSFGDCPYDEMVHSKVLGKMYEQMAKSIDMEFGNDQDGNFTHIGSTDMGNVSQEVSSICPTFDIGTDAVLHSLSFNEVCGSQTAFDRSMDAAKVLALTACEFICHPEKLNAATEQERLRHCSSSQEVLKRIHEFAHTHSTDEA